MVLVMATAEALTVEPKTVLTKVAMAAMLEAMPVLVLARIPVLVPEAMPVLVMVVVPTVLVTRRLQRVPTVLVAGSHGGHGGFHCGRVMVVMGMMAVMGMVVTPKKVVLCLQECIY